MKRLEVYQFERIGWLVISPDDAKSILKSINEDKHASGSWASVDIGLSRASVSLEGDSVRLSSNGREAVLPVSMLERASKSNKVFVVQRAGEIFPAEVRAGNYYKLRPVEGGAPTLEINGIHMHRIEGVDPWRDSYLKVAAARVRRGQWVLDSCTGLGYTAIHSRRRGARVVTVEVDENVVFMSRINPWSRGLEDPQITLILGDILEVSESLPLASFDVIIHDPPRLTSSTGDLYSLELYKRFYELLKPGGILFHYTGEPGRKRRLNIPRSVARRLLQAGFTYARFNSRVQGVIAAK